MSDAARTYLAQARRFIDQGEPRRGMQLLRKAKMVCGADPILKKAILEQMTHIAEEAGDTRDKAAWSAQLDHARRQEQATKAAQTRASGVPSDDAPRAETAPVAAGFFARLLSSRPRIAVVAMASVIVLCGIGIWRWPSISRFVAATPALADDAALELSLREAKPSILLVIEAGEGNRIRPFGTAWVVADGKLATNAHVANSVREAIGKNRRMFVRRPGAPPLDLDVVGFDLHPGWLRWRQIFRNRFVTKSGNSSRLAPAFDVALLYVKGDAGRPLPLADHTLLEQLRDDQKIGYVGFPMENILGVHENQEPTTALGRLNRVTDVFGQPAEYGDRFLLHHSMQLTGGASGSPMLDATGHVVGLVHAGNIVGTGSGARVSVGLNLGQGVDLLQELLDDTAKALQPNRDIVLQARLEEMMASPKEWALMFSSTRSKTSRE